jgi:hypothetical protein
MSKRRAHWRREHVRHYTHSSYSEERRSQPQYIAAGWVGPKDSDKSNVDDDDEKGDDANNGAVEV